MTKDEIQKLRDLPLIAGGGLLHRLGITLSHGRFLCPAHADHTPSATVSRSGTHWKCWSCGAGGNAIDLTMLVLNKDFKEACRWLADSHNVILEEWKPASPSKENLSVSFDPVRYLRFFEHPWLSPEACHFLFDERRLDPRVVRWCRLTSWRDRHGVNWLQTPYYDVDGRLIGVQNRNLDYQKPSSSGGGSAGGLRFRFPYGSQCTIYNLPVLRLLKPGEELWITEGCSDCWAMLSAGRKAIAIPSATLLKPQDVDLLLALHAQLSTRYKMAPDQDEPGERLFLQLSEKLSSADGDALLEHHQLPPGCKDFSDYYVRSQSD